MADDKNLKDEMKIDEVNEESSMSFSEVCRFVIFSVLFVAIILNQISTEKSYQISSGINQALASADPSDVRSAQDVIDWISDNFLGVISSKNIYLDWDVGDDEKVEENKLRVNMMNRIITPLRFVQKRMARKENDNDRTKSLVKYRWVTDKLDPYIDNKDNEDKNPFIPQHLIDEADKSYDEKIKYDMYIYKNTIGVSNSGGFMYEVNSTNNNQAIEFFDNTTWIDTSTAIIYVDFVTYNSHYAMLTYVNYLFTFTSSGLVTGKSEIRSSHYNKYDPSVDTIRMIFEGVYLLLLLFYTLIEIQEIKMDILSEKVKLKNQAESKKCISCWMVLEGLKKHFSDLWNMLDMASILLSYIGLGVWIQISNNEIVNANSIKNSTQTTDQVLAIIYNIKTYVKINSVNLLIIFFRLLKYLGKFERIRLLHQTFVRAKTEIFYFFILLIGIFLSFVIFGHVAFGGIHYEFSEIGLSFASCLIVLFTNMDTILELLELDFSMTALFIVLFTLFINFILANMFIAIINNSYAVELDNLEIQKSKMKNVEKVHWIFKISAWLEKAKLSILSKFSKKKAVVNKYADRDQQISKIDEDDEIIRAKNYDLDYNEAILWGERYDKEILTDKEKNMKIKKQTFNFSKRVWKAFIFIIFTVIYTVVLLSQLEIDKKYDLSFTVKNEIEGYESSNDTTLEDLGTYSDYAGWLQEAFSKIFSISSHYNLQGNFLVGQYLDKDNYNTCQSKGPIRLTLRYLKTKKNSDKIFKSINPIKRETDFSPFTDPLNTKNYENFNKKIKTSDPSCTVDYTDREDGGFAGEGGYIYFFSMDFQKYYKSMYHLLDEARFLNETLNSMVIDFVLYNGDLNYFIYSSFIAETISGGMIKTSYYIWPMKLNMYFTTGDKVRAVFEVIIFLLLVYHIFVTASTLRNKFRSYDDWSLRFKEILTTKQKEKRRTAKPEFLRKFSSIVTSYEILDFTSYSLSIICVIYWFMLIFSNLALNFTLPTKDADFHQKFSAQASLMEKYTNISSFNILLMYFRIMNYVTINKALSFLQDTMSVAMIDILYFLIMLVVILMGFVFMAYLSFGHTLAHYKSISDSFITCFAMMIGEFDYGELLEADEAMAYFFFFFYMLFFSFILLNIFIAILERSYTKVKETLGPEENNITVFESLVIFIMSSIRKALNRSKNSQEHQKDIKELAVCVFNRIENVSEEEEDPVSWAIKQTEEILLERQKRAEIKAPLDSIFRMRKLNVIEGGNFFFEQSDDLIKEFETRLDYWDYLRIGYLSFQSHEQKIRIKTEELIKKNETLFKEYKEIEKEKEDIMMDIQPIEVTLMKLKRDNEELTRRNKEFDDQ
jgi:hypothetical protein